MSRSIKVKLPSGEIRQLLASSRDGLNVLDWLASEGIELNARCRGKGRCRGCLVNLGLGEEPVRSCETLVQTLESNTVLQISERSLHDKSLSGITEFALLVERGEFQSRNGYGFAIDIGTTTVAIALWDLSEGECLGYLSSANAQIPFGDNIVSRIQYSLDSEDGLKRLNKAIWQDTILSLVTSLCENHGVGIGKIENVFIAGNPVMLDILCSEPLEGYGKYPFRVTTLASRNIRSTEDWLGRAGIPITLMGGMGPFVGADITAGLLSAGLDRNSGNFLFIDFGTNGEIVLKAGDRLLATATAAGPAFEGGNLNCGATAKNGVVSSIEIHDGNWQLNLVGDAPNTKGLSGAAYIDFLAEAFRIGLLNEFGRFDRKHPLATSSNSEGGVFWRVELGGGMYVSEPDVAEILQAKAAIAAGVLTLMEKVGLSENEIDAVYIAGGFGVHMNHQNAKDIGLLPDLANDGIEVLGNASLGGASLRLLYPEFEDRERLLLESVEIVELNLQESFEDYYTDCLSIGSRFELDA